MNKLFLISSSIIAIFILNCCKNENKSGNSATNPDSNSKLSVEKSINRNKYSMYYKLKNDTVKIDVGVNSVDSLTLDFDIVFSKKSKDVKAQGLAKLIRLENDGTFELPEQSLTIDMNKNEKYTCDSAFSYRSDNVRLIFGFEKHTKRRLSLTIQDYAAIDDDYTLYKTK